MKTKSKILIIISIVIFALGLTFFLVGGALSGWDIIGWFSSKWGYMTYIAIGTFILIFLALYVPDWIRRL